MKNILSFGGIAFHIETDEAILFESEFDPFYDISCCTDHVSVRFVWGFKDAPTELGNYLGSDALQSYYRYSDKYFCNLLGGKSRTIILTEYDNSYSSFVCYVNLEEFPYFPRTFGNLMRALPIRAIFQRNNACFFHASQIALGDVGILFTAPSGTGKTTQAKLWKKYCDARIICNDRTLIRNGMSYGFPIDGSEPVKSGEVKRLGAIVVISQAKENTIYRLRPSAALARLLPQLIFDGWDEDAQRLAGYQLIQLLSACPVYQLNCTADKSAVVCLRSQLIADGVIS